MKRPRLEAKLVHNSLSHLYREEIKLSKETLHLGLVKAGAIPEEACKQREHSPGYLMITALGVGSTRL